MSGLSRVAVERVCRCPFSVAHDYAEDYFKQTAARGPVLRIPLRDVFPSLRGHLRQPVRMRFNRRTDEAEFGRFHDVLEFSWSAQTRLFPDFQGCLRLRIASVDETRLTLEAMYRVPLAIAGLAFDVMVGRRIARASLRDFLDELCDALEQREEAFLRAATPAR